MRRDRLTTRPGHRILHAPSVLAPSRILPHRRPTRLESMGFVCQGRYVLTPLEATDAEKYVNLQLDCMEQTYDPLYNATLGESFTARHRAEYGDYLEDFHRHLAAPTVRGFFAYEVPGWTPESGLSCAVGTQIDWEKPVGLALSLCEFSDWEMDRADSLPALPADTRKLTHLYTLNSTHGTGLGRALFDSVIYPDENTYLWVMQENKQAIGFYRHLGFERNSIEFAARGIWAPGHSVRYTRILNAEA